jgi:prefoldin subunit 5
MDQSILIQKIKKWLEYESKIATLQKEIKELKKNRGTVSNELKTIMKSKDLDCIDVNNGKILYTTTEVKKGINKKYLSDILNKYFNDNHRAEEICQFILENRESQVKENIKLKKDKI